MKNIWVLLFCVFILICNFGCARTVTQIISYGDQMAVEVTLRGTMEANANRYFMVLSSNPSYQAPLPRPDNITWEAIEPGTTPQQGAMADYYANYYSTWAGYIMIEPAGYFLIKGPFIQGQEISREALASLGEMGTKIKFNFRLSRIFGAAVPDTIYFDFISVPWSGGAAKIPADHLPSTNNYVSDIVGSIKTIADEQNYDLDSALDIEECKVTIQ